MVEKQAVAVAEIAALRDQLRAAQEGAEAPYRHSLTWIARRSEAQAQAHGVPAATTACAALLLVHALRHTYDPRRNPVVWVDALIMYAVRSAMSGLSADCAASAKA